MWLYSAFAIQIYFSAHSAATYHVPEHLCSGNQNLNPWAVPMVLSCSCTKLFWNYKFNQPHDGGIWRHIYFGFVMQNGNCLIPLFHSNNHRFAVAGRCYSNYQLGLILIHPSGRLVSRVDSWLASIRMRHSGPCSSAPISCLIMWVWYHINFEPFNDKYSWVWVFSTTILVCKPLEFSRCPQSCPTPTSMENRMQGQTWLIGRKKAIFAPLRGQFHPYLQVLISNLLFI